MQKYVLYGEELKKMHDTQLQAMLEQYNTKLQQFETQLKNRVSLETQLKNEISESKAAQAKLQNYQKTLLSESTLKIQENDQQIHAMWENRLSESALIFKKKEVECTLKLKASQRELEQLKKDHNDQLEQLNTDKDEIQQLLQEKENEI